MPGNDDSDDLKRTLVAQASNGRTESLRELSIIEYDQCCKSMEKVASKSKVESAILASLRRQRRITLLLLRQIGIDTDNWNVVNKFVSSKKLAGKPFRELSEEEQEQLQLKLRMIIKKNNE